MKIKQNIILIVILILLIDIGIISGSYRWPVEIGSTYKNKVVIPKVDSTLGEPRSGEKAHLHT